MWNTKLSVYSLCSQRWGYQVVLNDIIMDVIIKALLCRNPDEEAAAEAFVSEPSNPAVYPPPLCLNMEPRGNQEFLEANVTVADDHLALSLNDKATTDILYRLPPYDRGCPPRCQELLTGLC